MRVLLVKPSPELRVAQRLQAGFLNLEPLELEIVAGGVAPEDDVRILDLGLEKKPQTAFEQTLREYRPDLIGFTGYSTNCRAINRMAECARHQRPGACIVVGGIHATLRPGDYRQDGIDAIVRGDGGTVIGEIIRCRKAGLALDSHPAVLAPANPDFERKSSEPIPTYPPLKDLPRPRRDLADRTRYFCVWTSPGERRPRTVFPRVASVRTSAGCPFRCSFCAIHHLMGGLYAQRTPEDVVAELAALDEDHIYFVDDEMFINARRALEIAELIAAHGIRKRYVSWARSDTIIAHPEVFRAWKAVGLDVVYVGIESMDATRLQEYEKRTTAAKNRQAAAILRETGIVLHAAFIVHPDFTVDEFRALEKTLKEFAPAEFTFTVLSPSPGTEFWESYRPRFICNPFLYNDCMHTILPTRLPLKRFYQHFGRVSALGLRMNPLRLNRVRIPLRELARAIVGGTRYVSALYTIYKDYPPETWRFSGGDWDEYIGKRKDGGDDEYC